MSKFTLVEQILNPEQPTPGNVTMFAKNKLMFIVDDDNTITQIGGGGITRQVVADINDPSAELNPRSGVAEGDFLIAFESVNNQDGEATLYFWDTDPDPGAENVPYTVDGQSGGRWIAFAGRYQSQTVQSAANHNFLRFCFLEFADLPSAADFEGMFAQVDDPTNDQQGSDFFMGVAYLPVSSSATRWAS